MDKKQICRLFNCTMDQLNAQYADNAAILNGMKNKARKTGKKVNNYTESQLTEYTDKYKRLSQS